MASRSTATKQEIKAFWEENPLMFGEISAELGSKAFFEAHEAIYRRDVFPRGGFPTGFFPFAPGAEILDVGCGPGLWTRELARRGYRVRAIDLSEAAVNLTRQSLDHFKLSAEVQQGDAENLPFPDMSLDGVVSHGVIHHTPDTQQCLLEMARVVKPGGRLVVSVYYRNLVLRSRALTRVVSRVFGNQIGLPGRGRGNLIASGDPDDIVRRYDGANNPLGKAYTAQEFDAMVATAGFRIVDRERFYFPLRGLGGIGAVISPLHSLVARRFGLLYMVSALKPF